MAQGITLRVPSDAIRLPDNKWFKNRLQVRSESSDALYTIGQSIAGKWWGCSCFGWIRHKKCKHLTAMGLPGKYQPFEPLLPGHAPAATNVIAIPQAPRKAARKSTTTRSRSFKEIAAARPRYNPAVESYGDAESWKSAFEARMGVNEARAVLGSKQPYAVLGLPLTATWNDVKKAYRKLALETHPDRAIDKEQAARKFREIAAAYAMLGEEFGK